MRDALRLVATVVVWNVCLCIIHVLCCNVGRAFPFIPVYLRCASCLGLYCPATAAPPAPPSFPCRPLLRPVSSPVQVSVRRPAFLCPGRRRLPLPLLPLTVPCRSLSRCLLQRPVRSAGLRGWNWQRPSGAGQIVPDVRMDAYGHVGDRADRESVGW
jgi:hypothetical protein